jgi:hypothetical protein
MEDVDAAFNKRVQTSEDGCVAKFFHTKKKFVVEQSRTHDVFLCLDTNPPSRSLGSSMP